MNKTIGFSFAYCFVAIIGLAGNSIVLLVVLRNRAMHTITNILIAHLSLFDIMIISFSTPGLLLKEISPRSTHFGKVFPEILTNVVTFCHVVSVFTMMAIAVERFFAIVYPLKQLSRNKKTTVMTAIIIIWACATSQLFVRKVVGLSRTENLPSNQSCCQNTTASLNRMQDEDKTKYYLISVFLLYNVFPFVAISYLYLRIIVKLRRRGQELGKKCAMNGGQNNSMIKSQHKTVAMLIVVPIVLLVCAWPYTILSIISAWTEFQPTNNLLLATSLLRFFGNLPTATNPIIYNFFGEKFRSGFLQVFCAK